MARTSTLYRFEIVLSDIDRGIYETLELRVPCHPSEEKSRLLVRVLARVILHEPGLDFGKGLSHTDEPALWTLASNGQVRRWVDVGAPSAERLHRASKLATATSVVTTKPAAVLKKEWNKRTIHNAEHIELTELPDVLVEKLAATLDRRNHWFVTIQDGLLAIAVGETNFQGAFRRLTLAQFL